MSQEEKTNSPVRRPESTHVCDLWLQFTQSRGTGICESHIWVLCVTVMDIINSGLLVFRLASQAGPCQRPCDPVGPCIVNFLKPFTVACAKIGKRQAQALQWCNSGAAQVSDRSVALEVSAKCTCPYGQLDVCICQALSLLWPYCIWTFLMSSVYSMPLFGHAPFVPMSLSLLCPYMEIVDVLRIQYAHIWACPICALMEIADMFAPYAMMTHWG